MISGRQPGLQFIATRARQQSMLLHDSGTAIHDPIFAHAVPGVIWQLHRAVVALGGGRENFNDEVGRREEEFVVLPPGAFCLAEKANVRFVIVAATADKALLREDFSEAAPYDEVAEQIGHKEADIEMNEPHR